MAKKKRPFDKDSKDKLEDTNISDAEIIEDKAPMGKTESPSLKDSPLLNSGRIEREYTASTSSSSGAGNSNPPEPKPDEKNLNPHPEQPEAKEPIYKVLPDDGVPEFNPNLIGGNSGEAPAKTGSKNNSESFGDQGGGLDIPEQLSNEAAKSTANAILDLYKSIWPEAAHEWTKLNEKEIKKHVNKGDLLDYAYDKVKEHNKDNHQKLIERASEDAKLLRKPLAKFFEIKNISTSPLGELIMAVVAVAVMNFILIKGIKSENSDLLEELTKAITKTRNESTAQQNQVLEPGRSYLICLKISSASSPLLRAHLDTVRLKELPMK